MAKPKAFVLEMHFPNGNIRRQHYTAHLLSEARNKAKKEYPFATEWKYLYSWNASETDNSKVKIEKNDMGE